MFPVFRIAGLDYVCCAVAQASKQASRRRRFPPHMWVAALHAVSIILLSSRRNACGWRLVSFLRYLPGPHGNYVSRGPQATWIADLETLQGCFVAKYDVS
jgi:hypothetical protein